MADDREMFRDETLGRAAVIEPRGCRQGRRRRRYDAENDWLVI